MGKVTRRSFVTTVGAGRCSAPPPCCRLAAQSAAPPHSAKSAEPVNPTYLYFNVEEALFIEAACERLIPADESGPGAVAAGVPAFLDHQLNGAWGAGERLYRSGPWLNGTPAQGYQLPFTPAELFHVSLRAINRNLTARGTPFSALPGEAQDAYLKSLESGEHDLDGVPSAVFFDALLNKCPSRAFSAIRSTAGTATWRRGG